MKKSLKRCWGSEKDPMMMEYHDKEWGVPLHDDRKLFEFLVLEGMQAGLSWSTILHKRENFRRAFGDFDPEAIAAYTAGDISRLLGDAGIIRNRLKIEGAISNARCYLAVQKEFGSFDAYIWQFVGGRPIRHKLTAFSQMPATSGESDLISKDLRQRGFKFVGSTIVYSHMQATGMINDHLTDCFRYRQV